MSGLALSRVTVARDGLPICREIDVKAPQGEVTVLLGPNGAGKTTLLESISGVLPVAAGSILLDGHELRRMRREKRARLGLAHVEQGRTVFSRLTVRDNLLAAGSSEKLPELLGMFPALEARRDLRAGLLSGGEQQMLVVARALASEPKMLLLDELSLGLAPTIVQQLMKVVRKLADQGIGILLVEQYAALALEIGDNAYILDRGEIGYSGNCQELRENPERLLGSYLSSEFVPETNTAG